MEGTLEAINDRLNPLRVYERRSDRVRQRWNSLKRSVMGSDDSRAGTSRALSERTTDVDVSGSARQARQAVSDASGAAKRRTRGNPLAAGIIAFGIGALIAGALPETEAERRAVDEADRHLDLHGSKQRLTERAQQVGDDIRTSAQDAVQDLKGTAQRAAQDVKSHAQGEGGRVTWDARAAKDRTKWEV